MNQTVRYIIMALLFIALVIWSVTVYRSCQEAKDPVDIEQTGDETSADTDTSGLEDLFVVEEDTTADEFADEGASLITEEDGESDLNYGLAPEGPSFDEGEFLVIAGAFIVEANAKKTVNRLKNQGYNDAEIRVFIGSDYHSAIVDAYEDMDEALDVAIKLADAGYKDVYVHKKRHRKKR